MRKMRKANEEERRIEKKRETRKRKGAKKIGKRNKQQVTQMEKDKSDFSLPRFLPLLLPSRQIWKRGDCLNRMKESRAINVTIFFPPFLPCVLVHARIHPLLPSLQTNLKERWLLESYEGIASHQCYDLSLSAHKQIGGYLEQEQHTTQAIQTNAI